jgi:hypothetical protein
MNYSVTFDNGISVDIKKEDNGKYAVLLEGVVGVFGCSQFERNLSIDIVGLCEEYSKQNQHWIYSVTYL